ncbi:MAG TPA: hypothetical protein VH397_04155, partial [Xanthobacteraceae bacterium]
INRIEPSYWCTTSSRDAGAQREIQVAAVGAVAPHAVDLVRGSGVAPQSRVEAFAQANDATVAPSGTAI